MVPDTEYWLGYIKHFFKLVVSRGISCLRLIWALTRRLLTGSLRLHPKHTKPRYAATYGSSCAVQGQPARSVSSTSPVNPVQSTSAINVGAAEAAPSSALAMHQYPPMTVPSIPQTPQPNHTLHVEGDYPRSMSPAPSMIGRALVQPFAPEEVQRYKRHFRINKKVDPPRIPPHQLDYSRPHIHGWERCIHPEGAAYFCWEHGGRRTITDSDIEEDQRLRDLTTVYSSRIWSRAEKQGAHGEGKVLVLAISLEEVEVCRYYFVSHNDKLVFWLQEFIPDSIFSGVKGVQAIDHIRYAVESQYWVHCELYPNDVPIEKSVVDELRSTLVFATSEAILSDDSLVPFSVTDLQQLLDLVTSIRDSQLLNVRDACLMYVVARLMRIFARLKFVNFHGQAGARLNADQSLYGRDAQEKHTSRGLYFSMLNIFLFGAASTHIQQLHRIWVDRTINVLRWRTFITMLSNEWNAFTIYSTVMLAVDVSFLAIPEMNGSSATQTIAQVAIYLSTMSAVGSLVASVLLTYSSRGQGTQSAEEAAAYMQKMADNTLGLSTLAVMFSVPFALVIWGMVFLVIALSTVVFGLGDLAPRMVVIPFWVLVAILASWPAWYKSEKVFFWLRRKGTGRLKKGQCNGADPV